MIQLGRAELFLQSFPDLVFAHVKAQVDEKYLFVLKPYHAVGKRLAIQFKEFIELPCPETKALYAL